MGTLWFDFGMVLFSVGAMVLISRFREVISAEDREGFRYISGGVALLAAVSVLNLHFNLGMLARIPFLSDPLSFRLIAWIGIISGTILLASGISTWMPLAQTYRKYNRQRVHRLELIKKVGQLVKVESRLSVILSRTLEHMVADYQLSFGAVYLYSRSRKTVRLVASTDEAPIANAALQQIEFDTRLLNELPDGRHLTDQDFIKTAPGDLGRPEIVQPVLLDGKPVGFFLAWAGPGCHIGDDDRINIQVATDIVARKIQIDQHRRLRRFRATLEEDRRHLVQMLDRRASFKDNVGRIAAFIYEKMPADLVSVTVLSDARGNHRYSLGTNRTLLHEIGVDAGWVDNSRLGAGEPLVINDILGQPVSSADQLVANSGMQSLVCVPLTADGDVEGVLTVASKSAGTYATREVAILREFSPVLMQLVVTDRFERNLSAGRSQFESLKNCTVDLGRIHGIHEMLQKAAATIYDELHPSMVRISTYDAEGTFLTSRTMLRKQESDTVTPSDGHMILSLMPWHRVVREKGCTITVDQSDPERCMTEMEISQAFMPEMSQALLVPVKVSDRVVAVMGLARIDAAGKGEPLSNCREFVEAIAATLSLSILLDYRREASAPVRNEQPRLSTTEGTEGELRGQIKSALTGIFGSVELIKSSGRPERNLDHYLSIIDRSARRISNYFAETEVK